VHAAVKTGSFRKNLHCYLWISPFFILMLALQVYPTIYGFYLSLTKYGGLEAPVFVGLKNYIQAFQDKKAFLSLGNTLVLWALIVPARTFLAVLIASYLNGSKRLGSKVYMHVVLLPYVTAAVVVAIVFRILLATDGGLINYLLANVPGVSPIGWLDTTQMSKVSIAFMNMWRMTGYFSLVMLAGMQKIPSSVYEAATVDGAGRIRKFFSITLPILMQEIFFVFLLSTIWVFQNIADSMLLTGGGPLNSSLTYVYYIYLNAYSYSNKMGYAAALSIILFVILLLVSLFLVKAYARKAEE
jgi:ABC-type sugar transport system permease subunit